MKDKDNFLKTIEWVKSTKSPATQNALASLQALRSGLRSLKDQGASKGQIDKVRFESLEALKKDILSINQQEREKIKGKLNQLGEYWNNNYQNNIIQNERTVRDYERKISAMSAKELQAEVTNVYEGKYAGRDPLIIDTLSAAVKKELYTDHVSLREHLAKARYTEPWLASTEGKALSTEYDWLMKNGTNTMIKNEAGEIVGGHDIASLYDALGQAEYIEMDELGMGDEYVSI